jgi:copper chaperone NosL
MRITAKLLLLAGGVILISVAALTLLPRDKQVHRNVDQIMGELCFVAPATLYGSSSGLERLAPKPIPADARCPVCGMYPARSPRWAAQIVFKDGASHFLDSPVDLFVFLQRIDHYSRRYALKDIAISYVADFETGQWIEAHHAFFVHGSTAFGPMRIADLPAFSARKSADTFARSRGGKVLTFAQVSPELIQSLSHNRHHRH